MIGTLSIQTFLFAFVFAGDVLASPKIESSFRQYDDSMTKVFSPSLDAEIPFDKELGKIKLGFGMDVLTSASPDVVSFGTKEIKEERKEFSFGTEYTFEVGTFSAGYIQSDEHDYNSQSASISGTKDFFEKNTVVGLGLSYTGDKITSATDTNFLKSMTANVLNFSFSQVISKQGIFQVLYDARIETGYTASPYRRARFRQSDGSVIPIPENHPQNRTRNSLTAKYNHFINEVALATATSLRYYFDNWDLRSWTFEEILTRQITKILSTSISIRHYRQSAASFYQDFYAHNADGYFTGNKTLSQNTSLLLGLNANFLFTEKFSVFAKIEKYTQDFQNYTDARSVADAFDDKAFKIDATIYGIGIHGQF